MVKLSNEQKNFIKTNLKPYLEKDDLMEVWHTLLHDLEERDGRNISAFLCEIGVDLLCASDGTAGAIKNIPHGMFRFTDIERIEIPPNIQRIGREAFDTCTELADVTFNEGLLCIERFAFQKTRLSSVVFPESLKTIDRFAFAECPFLREVYFKTTPENMSGDAFDMCHDLTVYIPESYRSTYNVNSVRDLLSGYGQVDGVKVEFY